MAGLSVVLLLALALAVLPTCELARTVRLVQPIEFFLLSDEKTPNATQPFTDVTGAITGFIAEKPGLIIERVEDIIVEVRRMPQLHRGRIIGKEPHRFARIKLLKRDRKRLEQFTTYGAGSVLLTRVNGKFVFLSFLTEPLTSEEFVVSGPDTEETREAVRIIQATLPGGKMGVWDK